MKNKFIAALVAIVVGLNPLIATASVCNPVVLHLGFTNGIQNTQPEANESLQGLARKTKSRLSSSSRNYLFYHTKGRPGTGSGYSSFKLDVLEVYWLLAKETVGGDPKREAQAMALFHHAIKDDTAQSGGGWLSNGLAWLTQAETDAQTAAFAAATVQNVTGESDNDVKILRARLGNGDQLMMAAHSQGTLWANAALTEFAKQAPELATQVRLSSAGMAASYVWQTPGSAVANKYTTSSGDKVINTIRDFAHARGMAEPREANSSHSISIQGHGFTEIYLDDNEPTGKAFLANFLEGMNQLPLENKLGSVLTHIDLDVNFGKTGQNLLDSGRWTEDFSYQTLLNAEGVVAVAGKETRTSPTAMHVDQTFYCSFVGGTNPNAASQTLPLSVALPTEVTELAISGTVHYDGKLFYVQRIQNVGAQTGFNNWAFANLTVSKTQGVVSSKIEFY